MRGFDKFFANFLFKKREKELAEGWVNNSIFIGPSKFSYY
jgi:hypothetical protein